MSKDIESRLNSGKDLAKQAGEKAKKFFGAINDLLVEQKGTQDLVSNADKEVELFLRKQLNEAYPDDGIVGEEYENIDSKSGYVWVIDPIDGTANFVRGIPAWCVVLACVHDDKTKMGVIYDPCNDEMFWGKSGGGAYLNNNKIQVAITDGLHDGSVGVGMSGRTPSSLIVKLIDFLVSKEGVFYRNASGALMLAYVASGRLLGYTEPHMNAWDCLAGQLIIQEAGGLIEQQSANEMLLEGGRVIASTPNIFDELVSMSDLAFKD